METTTLKLERMEPEQTTYWVDLVKWVSAWVSAAIATVVTFNQFVNRYFDWKKNQQQQFIEQIIDNKVSPEISELRDSIDQLKEAIWELKNKIKN